MMHDTKPHHCDPVFYAKQPCRTTHNTRMKTSLLTLTLAAALVSLSACQPEATPPPAAAAPAPRVKVAAVSFTHNAPAIEAAGSLVAQDEVKLSFKLGGIVERITVQEGAFIRRGQVLATLRGDEVNAGVVQARASYDKAKRDLARVEALYKEEVVT